MPDNIKKQNIQSTLKYRGYKLYEDSGYHNMIAVEKRGCKVHSPTIANAIKVIDKYLKTKKWAA